MLGSIDLTKVPRLGGMITLHVTPPSKRRSLYAFVLVLHSIAAFEMSATHLSTCMFEHTNEWLKQDHIVPVRTDVRERFKATGCRKRCRGAKRERGSMSEQPEQQEQTLTLRITCWEKEDKNSGMEA
jgi:hypothetical protein